MDHHGFVRVSLNLVVSVRVNSPCTLVSTLENGTLLPKQSAATDASSIMKMAGHLVVVHLALRLGGGTCKFADNDYL